MFEISNIEGSIIAIFGGGQNWDACSDVDRVTRMAIGWSDEMEFTA